MKTQSKLNLFLILSFILTLFSFDSYHQKKQQKNIVIENMLMYYTFLKCSDSSYTSIVLDGAKINSAKGLYFSNDSFFNRIATCLDLEILKLSNCHLNVIPKQIYQLKKLKVLELDVNNLDSIPSELKTLKSLENISMIYNRIRNIEFLNTGNCELPNLKYLFLRNNLIQTIPTNIELYKTLKILSLENNQIYSIPCSLSKLDNIEVDLFSSNCEIDSIPCCFNRPYSDFTLLVNLKNKKLPNCFIGTKVNSDSGIFINNGSIKRN